LPDKRAHRGPHPEDHQLFAASVWPRLRAATSDLSWLMSRGYADPSALKLVGDRYRLTERQRTAVMRCACGDESLRSRAAHRVGSSELAGQRLLIDGYNLLTTIEAAFGQGVLLRGRDGCCRDMASMHGTYRRVQETGPALESVGQYLSAARVGHCVWYLDRPVSNSGRLRGMMRQIAADAGWSWDIELVDDPDKILAVAAEVVATADSGILDRCQRWFNLADEVVRIAAPQAYLVDLSDAAE
jgi:hypothetical protein